MISVLVPLTPMAPNDLFCQSAMRRRCSASACSTFSWSSWEDGSATSPPDQPCVEGTFPQAEAAVFEQNGQTKLIENQKKSRFVDLYRFPFRVDMKSRATKIQRKIKRWEGSRLIFFVPFCCLFCATQTTNLILLSLLLPKYIDIKSTTHHHPW